MYSRTARHFLTPDPDHANPNLGPGCYTADEATLIAGKTLGENGYAPFSSLAPRVSYFDETIVHGPSPGAYDPPLQPFVVHNSEKASLFGKSRAIRFKNIVSSTPSPNTYSLPSSLKLTGKKNKNNAFIDDISNDQNSAIDHGKLRETITYKVIGNCADDDQTVAPSHIAEETEIYNFVGQENNNNGGITTNEKSKNCNSNSNIKNSKKIVIPKRQTRSADSKSSSKKPTIVWRRKYVPPSIPVGRFAFGYQENESGELIPRSPPQKKNSLMDPGPAYNFVTSFVEKNKHDNCGFRFALEKKGLKFTITDSPGPSVYDVSFAEKLMQARDRGGGPAVMTLASCVRLTDEIVTDALKKAVPGPGAYEFKPTIKNPRMPGANVPAFGSTSNHLSHSNYIPVDLMRTPAPGTYYPEFATINKPPAFRPQPFGSTTNRFDNSNEEKSRRQPAPGSYEIASFETMRGIGSKNLRLVMTLDDGGGTRPKAFGSISERFVKSKQSKVPGPGQYDIVTAPPPLPHATSRNGAIRTGLTSRKNSPTATATAANFIGGSSKSQKIQPQLAIVQPVGSKGIDPLKVRIPVFGTQTARFHNSNDADDLPPPGAYEIAHAFETLKTRGKIENQNGLGSQMAREFSSFISVAPPNVPGPGEYDVFPETLKKQSQHQHGAFLSSKLRFADKPESVPGPDAYLTHDYDNGLLKKTFNITLREWND
ncbi:Sperm-tail PG-rich repeat-containing protein 2 [Physocladia obscura]|uniref:Sperm-tail PG-rich repeat-containing protein 2 n=1 Tax=Physocladia obscura TaxID=109957 RepID=A0AAD5XEH9_9FUNG|nr:Sperm-tail PG-rich repeat-containing protein 2 [Physocladia obscura]